MILSKNKRKNELRFETAIYFARMYGVAETLQPLRYQDNEVVMETVKEWTEEYLLLLAKEPHSRMAFFEEKLKQLLLEEQTGEDSTPPYRPM